MTIVRQKSPERNKQVESKVKQYINRAIERNVHIRQRSIKKYENILPIEKPIAPKKVRCNTGQMLLKNAPQKIVPVPTPVPVLEEAEEPVMSVVKKENMNSFEAALNKEIKGNSNSYVFSSQHNDRNKTIVHERGLEGKP